MLYINYTSIKKNEIKTNKSKTIQKIKIITYQKTGKK